MIGRFVTLWRGQWFKTTYGKWEFSSDGTDLGFGAVIRDDEAYVVLEDIVKRRMDLSVDSPVRLTYRLPEIVPGMYENNGVPLDISCDQDVALFMANKNNHPNLVMCVTFGPEAVATYDFMQRRAFTVGRFTYLTEEQDPYQAGANLSAYNALITGQTVHAAQTLLDEMFTEAEMVIMHRIHLEMLYSNPIQQPFYPPQFLHHDPANRTMTQIIIIDGSDSDMDIDETQGETGGVGLESSPQGFGGGRAVNPNIQLAPFPPAAGRNGRDHGTLNLLDPDMDSQREDNGDPNAEANRVLWEELLAEGNGSPNTSLPGNPFTSGQQTPVNGLFSLSPQESDGYSSSESASEIPYTSEFEAELDRALMEAANRVQALRQTHLGPNGLQTRTNAVAGDLSVPLMSEDTVESPAGNLVSGLGGSVPVLQPQNDVNDLSSNPPIEGIPIGIRFLVSNGFSALRRSPNATVEDRERFSEVLGPNHGLVSGNGSGSGTRVGIGGVVGELSGSHAAGVNGGGGPAAGVNGGGSPAAGVNGGGGPAAGVNGGGSPAADVNGGGGPAAGVNGGGVYEVGEQSGLASDVENAVGSGDNENNGGSGDDELSLGLTLNQSNEIFVGMLFANREEFRQHMAIYALQKKFHFRIKKTQPERMVMKCWGLDCKWRVYAAKLDGSDKFEIRSIQHNHSCSIKDRCGFQRQATSAVIGNLMRSKYGGCNIGPRPTEIQNMMRGEHNVRISYWKAWKSRELAMDSVNGTAESSYKFLPSYMQRLVVANPGTLCSIETTDLIGERKRFKYMFFALGGSIAGFPYMRKVVVLDGTHLKGKYAGNLLTACAQDGNYQIFPIAFAIVDGETDESWEWFFRNLVAIVPNSPEFVFISDRHASIYNALDKVYPDVQHCACILHIIRNVKKYYRAKHLPYLISKAARAYRLADFYKTFNEIERMDSGCAEYLMDIGFPHWARAHFDGLRYDIMTTNVAESWNAVLREAREFPAVKLVEYIRAKIMSWFATRRDAAGDYNEGVTPKVLELLTENFEISAGYEVKVIDIEKLVFEVCNDLGISFHVDLEEKDCSCFQWQTLRFPCPHAVAAAISIDMGMQSLIAQEYSTSHWSNAYASAINPVVELDGVPSITAGLSGLTLYPPTTRRPPGRPRKTRFYSRGEMLSKSMKRRRTCSRCKQQGHNRATCKMPLSQS